MSTVFDCFPELSEFRDIAPGKLAFRAICASIDALPVERRELAIDAVETFLANWPDDVREAPWSWCRAAAKGMAPPTWRLVRSLQLRAGHLTKGEADLAVIARRADLSRVTVLEIPQYSRFSELSLLHHRPKTPRLLAILVEGAYRSWIDRV